MKQVKGFFTTFFNEWGFAGPNDYFLTILGLKTLPFFNLQLVGTVVAAGFAFCANWIWDPPGAAFLIIGMSLVNARYGYLVSKKIKGEGFRWSKFHRTFSVVVSDLLIMSLLHIAIKYYPYYSFMADLLFGWLLTHKGRAILHHMVMLNLQEGGLAGFLRKYIIKIFESKAGIQVVDSLQEKPKETNGELS